MCFHDLRASRGNECEHEMFYYSCLLDLDQEKVVPTLGRKKLCDYKFSFNNLVTVVFTNVSKTKI